MGFFDFLKGPDINEGMERCVATPDAVLLDVRTGAEYQEGHLPGSRNIPVDALPSVDGLPADLGTPLFVYCLSGARSSHAAAVLRHVYKRQGPSDGRSDARDLELIRPLANGTGEILLIELVGAAGTVIPARGRRRETAGGRNPHNAYPLLGPIRHQHMNGASGYGSDLSTAVHRGNPVILTDPGIAAASPRSHLNRGGLSQICLLYTSRCV